MPTLNVGSMAARLGLDAAEFMDKMKGVQGFNGFMSAEMSRQWRETQREGTESFRLIDEAIGVHLSRPLTRLLTSEFPAFAAGLQAVLGASVVGALAAVGIEAFEKVARSIEKAQKAQEEWKAAIVKTESTIESVADSYARKIAEANGIDPMLKRAMAGADEAKSAFDKVAAAIDEENKKALEAQGTWTQFKASIGDAWHEIFTSDTGLNTEKLQGQLGTLKTEIQDAFRLDALHGSHEAMKVFQRDLEMSTQKLRELKDEQAKQSAAPPPDPTLWKRGPSSTAEPAQKVTPEQIAAVEQWVTLLDHAKDIEQEREKLERADAGAAARAQALRDEEVAQGKISALYKEMGSSLAKLQPETDPIKKLDAEIAAFRSTAEANFRAIGQSAASALATSAALAGLDSYEKKLDLVKAKLEADIYAKQALDLLSQPLAGAKQKSTALPFQLSTAPALPTLGAGGSAGAKLDTFAKDQAAQLKLAAAAYEAAMTAQDRYKLGVQELDLLLKEHLIDETARAAGMAQLSQQLVKAADSAHKLQEEMQKLLERSDSAAAGMQAFGMQLQINAAENGKFTYDLLTASTKGAEEDATKTLFDILDEQRGGHLKLIHDLEAMWSGYFKNLASMGMKNAMDQALAPLGKAISGGTSAGQKAGDGGSEAKPTGLGGFFASLIPKKADTGATSLTSAGTVLHSAATALLSAATALRASAAGGAGGAAGSAGGGSAAAAAAGNAMGTDDWAGGPSWVGEQGPELINLPRGSQVIPNNLATRNTGGDIHHHYDMRGSIVTEDVMRRTEAVAAIHASERRMMAAAPTLQREINLRKRT
ncbi:MAG TPA: hypothetical protein VK812_13285 [Candidatus Binatus sp.]|nr:hypothetical protein [Candidatus Binatus sp.]